MTPANPSQSRSANLTPLEYLVRPFAAFFKLQMASGILLMLCAVIAVIWANSPWGGAYVSLWHTKLTVAFGEGLGISKPLILWVNDGLMAIFFLLVGLEIKRELLTGELATPKKAALPAAAALGGMLVPALVFTLFNFGRPTQGGWGIPMATDIAFSLGVLAMLGKRAPLALKVFLTALAIVDDLGAVLVIALFYTAQIQWAMLGASLAFWILALLFGRIGGRHPLVFILLGLTVWYCMLKSGVHATIAGVLMALAIPGRALASESHPATERWEHGLHPWVAFIIMPIFALANSGVLIGEGFVESIASPGALGIIAGLVLGKPIGIAFFSWLAVKAKIAELPHSMNWVSVIGVGVLGGIGFTMSLFIAELAYAGSGDVLNTAKAGIIVASILAGIVGYLLVRSSKPAPVRA